MLQLHFEATVSIGGFWRLFVIFAFAGEQVCGEYHANSDLEDAPAHQTDHAEHFKPFELEALSHSPGNSLDFHTFDSHLEHTSNIAHDHTSHNAPNAKHFHHHEHTSHNAHNVMHSHHHEHAHGSSLWAEIIMGLTESIPWLILGLVVSGALEALTPSKKQMAFLFGRGTFFDVVIGAAFGICMPLCSCGALPVAVSVAESGASPPAVVAFVTAAQSAGIDSALITYGVLGARVAVARLVSALLMAIASGLATPTFAKKIRDIAENCVGADCCSPSPVDTQQSLRVRISKSVWFALTKTFDEIVPWVTAGLLLTAAISVYAPSGFVLGRGDTLVRIIALAGSLPLQLCEHGTVTFAAALRRSGASSGTAFAFLVAAPATNFATLALLLNRQPGGAMGVLRISVSLTLTALALSYVFDILGLSFDAGVGDHALPTWFVYSTVALFVALAVGSLWRRCHHLGLTCCR